MAIDIDESQPSAEPERTTNEGKAIAARRRDLERLEGGGLPDLADLNVMTGAWRHWEPPVQ